MKIEKLLHELAKYGGSIVLLKSLTLYSRNQARASGRIFTDKNSVSYVWEPPARLLPITDEEIQDFERWYPLEVELPESLKSADFLFKKKKNKKPFPEAMFEKNPTTDFSKTIYGQCKHGNNLASCMECENLLLKAVFGKHK